LQSQVNPFVRSGLDLPAPDPISDARDVTALLTKCPAHQTTPLHDAPSLAQHCGVARISIKDERDRMGLGSFKALGAAHAIARDAAAAVQGDAWQTALAGRTYVTASAGNHGLSVAAGARIFGARAIVYLSATVPEAFADRLGAKGAEVVRAGTNYEESMQAAEAAAQAQGDTLLSDSAWEGYTALPLRVMEGYLQLAAEAATQCPAPPTHILLQAGVGGFAAAVAAHARASWGDKPEIIVVEPDAAPALYASIAAGAPVTTEGPVSDMGRLDCKTPSLIGLRGLARDADSFVLISEDEAAHGIATLKEHGFSTSTSGGAGLAALITGLALPRDAHVLAFLTEGPADG